MVGGVTGVCVEEVCGLVSLKIVHLIMYPF